MSKTYHISTFGCQMNARDSEKLSGVLEQMGYVETDSEDADLVLLNTCTVRENANERVYGHLGQLKNMKKNHPGMIIGICGCMMQEQDEVEKIRRSYPFVDLVFGTHSIWKFPVLIREVLDSGKRVFDTEEVINDTADSLPVKRVYSYKSGVNIMYGCDNFCTYCIVPYVRGRERSRMPEDIIAEVKRLAADGVVEVMLLGQNVNSYGKRVMKDDAITDGSTINFAQLLREVCSVDGIQRVRFMTSHPKDLSDELIDVIAQEPKVCRHLHLPLQSGSTRLLERMNRHYTKESYLALVDKIRTRIPDISITTDIIVGFPGETDADFEDTMDVVNRAGFESAFTFIYSKRTGTPAASMPDQVAPELIKVRFDRLLARVQEIAAEKTALHVGREMTALIEEKDDHLSGYVTGRLSNNMVVHIPGTEELIGRVVNVRLNEAKGFYYIGEMI